MPRASAEKFSGGGATEKKIEKIAKNTENSTIRPLPWGRGAMKKKDRKIALLSLIYYICNITYENPGGPQPPDHLLPTLMDHAIVITRSPVKQRFHPFGHAANIDFAIVWIWPFQS